MDRRRFLRHGAALAFGGPVALAACADDTGPSAGPATSTVPATTVPPTTIPPTTVPPTPPSTTVPYDPARPYWLQGGFAPVTEELAVTDLTVTGSIPSSLHGLYTRNGSNPVTGNSPHWFFGDGMIHGVRFERGAATWYGNRWVDTPLWRERREFGDFGGPPGQDITQSNVSIFQHGGRLLALGEIGWPYEIDPEDLGSRGTVEIAGGAGVVGPNVTAHPKRDPATGLLHFFGYGFVPPYLTYYVASADGTELLVREEIDVAASTMIHDFAITETDVVFWELPVLFDLAAASAGSLNPFQWTPDYGSRVGVMPLGGPASEMRWVEIDNGYVFHGTNAHRDGDQVVLDVSRMPSMFDQAAPDGGDLDDGASLLTRWTIDTAGPELSWSTETLSEVPLDLPEIDDRFTGRRHSVAWLVEPADHEVDGPMFAGIGRYEVGSGELTQWRPGPAVQPNEVTFVPDSPDAGEGEGWLLTFTWDATTDRSALAILDATDVTAGPVATVELPQRVPFGFHGTWLAGV